MFINFNYKFNLDFIKADDYSYYIDFIFKEKNFYKIYLKFTFIFDMV